MSKILLIDYPPDKQNDFAQLLTGYLPYLDFTLLDPADGIPSADYPWGDFELILMAYDLGNDDLTGFHWLQTIRKYPTTPPVTMLFEEKDTRSALNALRMGAVNYIIRSGDNHETIIAKIAELLDPEDIELSAENVSQNRDDSSAESDNLDQTSTLDLPSQKSGYPEIPGYNIEQFIAKGGMAEVLLAKSEEDGQQVVLKIMHLGNQEDKVALKRFIKEYNLISNVDHPHIIKIYERAFASDFAYIAMEYFPNGDLSRRIKQGIKPDTALEYLRQMALGLEAAHDLGIVHRDLKPGNFLFRDDETLTITDFGVAKLLSEEATEITIDNSVVGTPYYLSPEQGTGMKVDHRSDLYSLGVIFYQMLTGKRPYTADSIAQLVYAHLNNPIPVLRGELEKYQPLIDGLLAKDPNERFQNAKELLLGIDWIK